MKSTFISIPEFADMLGVTRQHGLRLAKANCPFTEKIFPRPERPVRAKHPRMKVRKSWAEKFARDFKKGDSNAVGQERE